MRVGWGGAVRAGWSGEGGVERGGQGGVARAGWSDEGGVER